MTHAARQERRLAILQQADAGASAYELAQLYQMDTAYVARVINHRMGVTTATPERKAYIRRRKYTAQEQADARKQAKSRWKKWKHASFTTCSDYKGECCNRCHQNHNLRFYELPEGKVAYICCGVADSLGLK